MLHDNCLIGIDAGTSLVRAVAFDSAGRVVCSHELPLPLHHPQPLWAEQDMDELWHAVTTALGHVARQLQKLKRGIAGVGLTAASDGTFLMTRDGQPVRRGIVGCDGRAGQIVARWHASGAARAAFPICGTAVFAGSQAAQLAWLREHEPAALRQAATIFHAKDWLFFKLTGVISTDETDESLTMLRMASRQYDPELFRLFGLKDQFAKFPPVRPSKENIAPVLPAIARRLGLPASLIVGAGPAGVAAGALGSGAIEHGQASTILGPAGIHQVVMDRPLLKPDLVGTTLCHGVKNRWLRGFTAMTATANLEWFLAELAPDLAAKAKDGEIYPHLEQAIRKIPAGADGVIFHPYLSPDGERGPFVKPAARASFTGLSLHHTRAHLLRAVYEGVAFATLDCYRHMPITPKSVLLSGDGARSEVWCQIIADCLGLPVHVPEGSQFEAKGAALNVGVATGVYRDSRAAVKRAVRLSRSYRPNRAKSKRYAQLYEIYRETARRQLDLWDLRRRILA